MTTTRLSDDEMAELRSAAKERGLHIRIDLHARGIGKPFLLIRTGNSSDAMTLAACGSYEEAMLWLGVKK